MALPPFLLKEVRSTFQFCARQHVATRRCPLSCSATSLKSRTKPSSSSNTTVPAVPSSSKSLSDPNSVQDDSPSSRQGSQGPVRQQDDGKALERARKAEVPMKVLPRAELSSKHKLSPMQRLHIEHLTRHPPKQPPTKGRSAKDIKVQQADLASFQRKASDISLRLWKSQGDDLQSCVCHRGSLFRDCNLGASLF